MTPRPMTPEQIIILRYLATVPGDDAWNLSVWVAEGCGHAFDTPWAGSRLPQLLRRGYVEKGGGGYWRITDAGRAALAEVPA